MGSGRPVPLKWYRAKTHERNSIHAKQHEEKFTQLQAPKTYTLYCRNEISSDRKTLTVIEKWNECR
jgi:hypothetical protein